MNAEQLNSARLARWSQNGEARLTQETAAEWLQTVGFSPYLPAGNTSAAPTASFLEAVVGRPAAAPSAGERSRALALLARLIENSSAVPLKLGNTLGEQPDFVVSQDALAYVYALLGDRNFKTGPSTVGNEKVTTLAQHCWQAIEQHGPLDVAALQPILGRDMTEAAISRALQELWNKLYIFPILSATGQAAQWELLARRFPAQVAAGARTGQAESQSAMVSLYLHAVVAAMEEEILAFLSPLAPQSKLREVIRGLGSMRQLDILDIDGRSHVCLQGGLLPEMVTQLSELQLAASAAPPELEIERAPEAAPPRMQEDDESKRFMPKKFVPKKFVPKKFVSGQLAAGASGTGDADRSEPKRFAIRASGSYSRERSDARPEKRSGASSSYRSAGPRTTGPRTTGPRTTGFRGKDSRSAGDYPPRSRSFRPRDGDARGSGAPTPATRGLGERARRWEKSGEDADARPAGDRKPYASKSFGGKSFGSKSGGFKSSGFKPKGGFKSAGFQPAGSKPWATKGGVSRGDPAKPWMNRRDSRPAGTGRDTSEPGERPKRWERSGSEGGSGPRTDRKPYGAKSATGRPSKFKPSGYTAAGFKSAGAKSAESRQYGSKPGGSRPAGSRPWVSKGAESRVGSAKSYAARAAGKPFSKPFGAKPWKKRPDAEGEGNAPRREKSETAGGEKRGAKPFWSKNPRGGKGSAPASRTNRPRGKDGAKKTGNKKSGKRK